MANHTPIKPTSIRPIVVNRVLEEKGVIMAHPGNKSLAFLSIEYIKLSSLENLLYKVFWFLAANNLQRHASLVNFNCLQLAKILCCVVELKNIFWNFWSMFKNDCHLILLYSGFFSMKK